MFDDSLAAPSADDSPELSLATLVEGSPIPIVVATNDAENRVLVVSRAFTRTFGYTRQDVPDVSAWWPLAYPDPLYRAQIQERWGSALDGARSRGELETGAVRADVRCKDGAVRTVDVHMGVLGAHSLVVFHDHTERVRADRMRSHVQLQDRLAAVGVLAAGVAHELNSPLAYSLASLELLEQELALSGSDATRAHVAAALDGVRRAADIVRGVRAFARAADDRSDATDVRDAVDAAVRMTSSEIRPRARLRVDVDDDLPCVSACAGRLAQVLVNLLVHAAHAIPEGNSAGHQVHVRAVHSGRGGVTIHVEDTGSGLDDDARAHVFEPFHAARAIGEGPPVGRGMGLGLFVSRDIVTSFGGTIGVERGPGGVGTRFSVTLAPATTEDRRAVGSAARGSSTHALPVRGRVLVVDDEPLIGRTTRLALEGAHDVVVVESGQEAIDRLTHDDDFDVVLCDLAMEPVSGVEVHAFIARRRPELLERFVLTTGGAFTPVAMAFLSAARPEVLEKPASVRALRDVIARHVARSRGARGRRVPD